MSDRTTLQIQQISAHPGPVAGEGMQRQDTGVQADRHHHLHRLQGLRSGLRGMERYAVPDHPVRQHLPDDARHRLELLEPHQVQRGPACRWQLRLADAQAPVHALRRSRMPARLSGRRRDRAVLQRHRRFPAGKLHWLPVLCLRLPVQHSQVQSEHQEGLQVHAVLGPGGSGSGARLHQVMSHRLPALRHQRRHEVSGGDSAPRNCATSQVSRMQACTIPDTIGGTHVIYVLHDITKPEKYGNLPAKPRIPLSFTVWKDIFKPIGLFGAMLGFVGVVMHYVFEGPRRTQPTPPVMQIDPPPPPAGKEN